MEKCGGFAVRTGVGGVARGARFCSGREAATHVAAKAACVHVRLACAFVLLRCPKAPLRETWLPLLAPPLPCRMTMRGGVISALDARKPRSARQRARPLRGRHPVGLHGSLALAPSAVKTVSTLFYNRANTVSLFTLFEKYCISFVQQMYYMYIIKTYGHAHVHYMFTEIAA